MASLRIDEALRHAREGSFSHSSAAKSFRHLQ
jgi:hypothetical protein